MGDVQETLNLCKENEHCFATCDVNTCFGVGIIKYATIPIQGT